MTRYRLTSSTTAPAVTPAIQSYSHDQGSRRQLLTTDSSALTSSAYTPDAVDHSVAGDAHHIQFVSDPLAAGVVYSAGNALTACIQGFEPNANCNQTIQLFASVVNSSGVEQAVIRSKVAFATELATALTARFLSTTLSGSYTTSLNDRLVIEISTVGTPAGGGGVQGHNATLRWGGNGAGGDLAAADGETGTTLNPWVEVTESVNHVKTVTDPLGIVDTAEAGLQRVNINQVGLVDSIVAVLTSIRVVGDVTGLLDEATDVLTPGGGDSHTRTIQRVTPISLVT